MLARAVKRARGSLLWERLWPALATLAVAAGLFFSLSWAGLWIALPPLPRAIALVLFLIVIAVAAIPLFRLKVPNHTDALRRLDRGSGQMHRPATAVGDEIAANQNDPVAQALWRAHVERALISARKLKAGWPRPQLSMRDPMALRALTLLLVVATFFAAGNERVKRITAAFDWHGISAPANFRIDAWVTPPLYTGRAPLMLPGLRPGDTAQSNPEPQCRTGFRSGRQPTRHPLDRQGAIQVKRVGGLEEAPPEKNITLPAGTEERRYVIKGDGSLTLQGGGLNRTGLDLQRDSRSRADHRADQGSRTAGARVDTPRLQDG